MNIALSTLVIFILILPGIIYRRFYFTEEFSKQYFKQSIFGIFTSSVVPALVLHIIWYFLVPIFSDTTISLNILGYFFSQGDNLVIAFENIQKFDIEIAIYQISILSFAAVSGFLSKYLIRFYKLDRRRKLFRFQNSWHYLFTGEFFDFPKAAFDLDKDDVKHIEYVYVDALLEIKEGSFIYEGILVDYELSKDGGLEYIILKETYRRLLSDDEKSKILLRNQENVGSLSVKEDTEVYSEETIGNTEDFHFPIRGHIVVIPYKDIKNINFAYYKIVEVDKDNGLYNVVMVS